MIILIIILLMALYIVSLWKVFEKNNKPGWAALVPFYNIFVECEIAGLSIWFFLLCFVPIVNLIANFIICINLSLAMKRTRGFGVGLALLPYVFMPIAAFSKPKNKGKKSSPIIVGIMLLIFALFVIGTFIPWESLISKFTAFTHFNSWLSGLKIGKYAIFNNIIGAPVVLDATYGSPTGVIASFGTWQLMDLAILLFILTAVIAVVSNIKFDEFVSTITNAIKNVLPVAITAMLVSIVLVIMVTTGVNITIVNAILTLTKGFNIATSFIASLVGSVLTSDFYYLLSTTGAVFTSAVTNKEYYGVLAFIIQSISKFAMIFAPTSVGLVIGLYYLNIPYNKWFKFIWKLLLALFILIIVMSVIIYALV